MSSKEMKTTKLSSHFLGAVVESGEIMGSVLACIGGLARNATPPRTASPGWASSRKLMHVHDLVTHLEKGLWWQRLGKEICQIFSGVDVFHADHVIFDELPDIEVAPVDVFCTIVKLRVVREVDCGGIVHMQRGRFLLREA